MMLSKKLYDNLVAKVNSIDTSRFLLETKYITISEFNTLATDVFNARLAQANLVTKTDFDVKRLNLNRKITANKSKHLLVENKFKKLKTLIRFNLEVKVTLKKMARNII